jgi:hypothetical protein
MNMPRGNRTGQQVIRWRTNAPAGRTNVKCRAQLAPACSLNSQNTHINLGLAETLKDNLEDFQKANGPEESCAHRARALLSAWPESLQV